MKLSLLRQIIIMSKYFIYGTFIQVVLSSLLLANTEGNAQKMSIQNVFVDIKLNEATLEDIFDHIESQTSFQFVYNTGVIKKDRKISHLTGSNLSLAEVLINVSKETDLKFRRVNKDINVTTRQVFESRIVEEADQSSADVDITGKITDENSQGLPGASVVLKGTTNGTTTDLDGNYKLSVPEDALLTISFVGYLTEEVSIAGRSTIDLQMKVDAAQLEEVMVVAYGTTSKETFTGSASRIGAEQLDKLQATSISQALQGASAGVEVRNSTGQPGNNATIRIRGIASINGNSNPLFVVDGAPFSGNLSSIDPNDVESMTVLKDAAATALYGSRASAGVVVITTKKGSGKGKINISSSYGMSDVSMPMYRQVSDMDLYALTWEGLRNGHLDANPSATASEAATVATDNLMSRLRYNTFDQFPLLADGSPNPAAKAKWATAWMDEIFQPGPRHEHHVSLSGSTDDGTNYYMSLGYLQDKGTMAAADYKRFSARMNVSKKVNKWFETGMNTSLSRGLQNTPVAVYNYRFALDLSNIYPPWLFDDASGDWASDENGDRIFDIGKGQYNGLKWPTWVGRNPLAYAKYIQNENEKNAVSSRSYMNFTLYPGLVVKNSLSVDYNAQANYTYFDPVWSHAANAGGSTSRSRNALLTTTLTNLVSYTKDIGKHNVEIMAGHEAYKLNMRQVSGSGSGFPTNTLREIGAVAEPGSSNSFEDNHAIESYLSQLKYNYDGKYYLSASIRKDGTSRFHADARWGNFWSVGGRWLVSKESFMQSVDWIDNLSIRSSYGSQGNERISNYYASLGLYSAGNEGGESAFKISSFPSKDLKWETNTQLNVGVDVTAFQRFSISAEYFVKNSNDLLFSRELTPSTGGDKVNENVGDIRNNGVEVQITSQNIVNQDFSWETSVNLTTYKNEIINLPNEEILNGRYKWVEGRSVYDFYLKEYAGVERETGHALFYKDIVSSDGTVTGREKITDSNVATYYFVGSSLPKLFGNITNNFSYKGFDLSFNFLFKIGGKVYDDALARLVTDGTRPGKGLHALNVDRWTPDNKDSLFPRLTSHGATGNKYTTESSRFLFNGTYMRLRNLTLGYTLPKHLLDGLDLSKVRVYVQADNYLTFFENTYGGLDPEVGFNGDTDQNNITVPKILSIGTQISF